MQRFSAFSLFRQGLGGHKGWKPQWRNATPKPSYDAIIVGGGGHGLGAVYESAWLVFRMLAQERSNESIVAFYESVRDGADVDDAARRHLGLSVAQITTQWRAYLEKSASTVS